MIFSFIIYHLFGCVFVLWVSIVQYGGSFSFDFYFKDAIILEKNDGMRTKAILVGLVVTFIWATSWILTPLIIQEFDPIHYAGVRFFDRWGWFLVGVHLFSKKGTPLSEIRREDWRLIFFVGGGTILIYAIYAIYCVVVFGCDYVEFGVEFECDFDYCVECGDFEREAYLAAIGGGRGVCDGGCWRIIILLERQV